MDERYSEIIQEAIRKAELIPGTVAQFYDGLRQMIEELDDRIDNQE